MQVKSYDLFFDIDFRNLKFKGSVHMEVESEKDITINSIDLNILNIKANRKPTQFNQNNDELIVKTGPFAGILEVEYTGIIPNTLVGFYKAPYNNTYILTTQFEAAHARRMFPCLDHPGHKAEFKLTVRIDRDLSAISNMPIESVTVEGNMKVVSFQKTPKMSTYLLYLGVGRFEEVSEKVNGIDVIVATSPGKGKKGKFALEMAKRSIDFYQSYFGIPYVLPKVHLIAVPEFAFGAMENWGAISFREVALLVDENSSFKTRKRVTEIVAHELAHMWFGNLVTMKWWNDLWLNESFATFVAYKALDKICPHWKVWQDFLNYQTSGAMTRDSLKNTHPIEVAVKSPSEIEQIFDDISYGKGASILRMIEAYTGEEDFRKGVISYLTRYRFSNATGKDLWTSLEEASGKQIKTIMSKWIQKPGYPVVTSILKGGSMTLQQERFLLSGAYKKDVWPIPLTARFDNKFSHIFFNKDEETVDIKGYKSFKLNIDQTGFYRVHYQKLYDLVLGISLSAFDRWGIVSDAFAFLMSKRMSFNEYITLVKKYLSEEDYLPALEVSDQLDLLYSIIPSKIVQVSMEFHGLQLQILKGKTDENSSMLRGVMAARLATVFDDYAKKLGSRFHEYNKVHPDMKEAVAIAYARAYSDFEGILSKYRESASDEERIRLLNSMMNFKETYLVALSLGLSLSGEVKRQDVAAMLLMASRNPQAREVIWMWIKTNIGMLRKIYAGTAMLSRIMLSIIPIIGIGKANEIEEFFKDNKIPEAEKGLEAGLEKLIVYDRLAKN